MADEVYLKCRTTFHVNGPEDRLPFHCDYFHQTDNNFHATISEQLAHLLVKRARADPGPTELAVDDPPRIIPSPATRPQRHHPSPCRARIIMDPKQKHMVQIQNLVARNLRVQWRCERTSLPHRRRRTYNGSGGGMVQVDQHPTYRHCGHLVDGNALRGLDVSHNRAAKLPLLCKGKLLERKANAGAAHAVEFYPASIYHGSGRPKVLRPTPYVGPGKTGTMRSSGSDLDDYHRATVGQDFAVGGQSRAMKEESAAVLALTSYEAPQLPTFTLADPRINVRYQHPASASQRPRTHSATCRHSPRRHHHQLEQKSRPRSQHPRQIQKQSSSRPSSIPPTKRSTERVFEHPFPVPDEKAAQMRRLLPRKSNHPSTMTRVRISSHHRLHRMGRGYDGCEKEAQELEERDCTGCAGGGRRWDTRAETAIAEPTALLQIAA